MLPFGPWLIIATWTAIFARSVHVPLARRLGNRPRLAAVVTVVALTLLSVPAALLLTSIVADAVALLQRLIASDRAQELFAQLVRTDDGHARPASDLVEIVVNQSERAWSIARQIAGTAMRGVIGLFILLSGTYVFLIDGDRWYLWIETRAPISRASVRRLASAFEETGRGLIIGMAGAGIAQAVVATIIYVAIGVPQPFALGLLTLVFSVLPAFGTAIVWVPVAAGLALTGRPAAAVILVIAGIALIGSIDNIVRPYLARRGHLQLPTFVVLVSMFGGIELIGGWGVIVGPLVVRLAKETLEILETCDADSAIQPSIRHGAPPPSPAPATGSSSITAPSS